MTNLSRFLALAAVFGLLLGPAPAWSTGIIRVAKAGRVQPGPLAGGWQKALGRAFGSRAFASGAARLGGVLPALGRMDVSDPAKQGSFIPVAASLESLGHTPESFAAIAASDSGLDELKIAQDIARQAVRAAVRDRAQAIAAGGDAREEANFYRAIELMKMRADQALYMDKGTLAELDRAYETAQRQYAGTRFARELRSLKAWSAVLQEQGLSLRDEDALARARADHPPHVVVGARPSDRVAAFSELPHPESLRARVLSFNYPMSGPGGLVPGMMLREKVLILGDDVIALGAKVPSPKQANSPASSDLSPAEWRVARAAKLDRRAELGQKIAVLRAQRSAAGRPGSAVSGYIREEYPLGGEDYFARAFEPLESELAAIEAELDSPVERARIAADRTRLADLESQARGYRALQEDSLRDPAGFSSTRLGQHMRREDPDFFVRALAPIEDEIASIRASLPGNGFVAWVARVIRAVFG